MDIKAESRRLDAEPSELALRPSTPMGSRTAVFKFVGACCVSLRLVAVSLRYTGLSGAALCVGLRAFACFCAPVLPSLLSNHR